MPFKSYGDTESLRYYSYQSLPSIPFSRLPFD